MTKPFWLLGAVGAVSCEQVVSKLSSREQNRSPGTQILDKEGLLTISTVEISYTEYIDSTALRRVVRSSADRRLACLKVLHRGCKSDDCESSESCEDLHCAIYQSEKVIRKECC